jgi:exonuclease III
MKMQVAIWYRCIWGLLWVVFWSVRYTGAAPTEYTEYTRDQLFNIREFMPATPMLPSEVLRQVRFHGLNIVPKSVRGTRAGRSVRHRLHGNNHSHSSQRGVNHNNLISVKLTPTQKQSNVSSNNKTQLAFGMINARSVKNKCTVLNEFISDNKLDVVGITETWLGKYDQPVLHNLCPAGYKIASKIRQTGRGGGVAIIYNADLKVKIVKQKEFASFEIVQILIQSPGNTSLSMSLLYRPPPSKKNQLSFSRFCEDISDFLDTWILDKNRLLLSGDFNFHVDDVDNKEATHFLKLMESYGLSQHVSAPTHNRGHTLDLVFTRELDPLVSKPYTHDTLTSDHHWVLCDLLIEKPKPDAKVIKFRKFKDIDMESFRHDITTSLIGQPTAGTNLEDLISNYDSVLSGLLEKHAPQKSLKVTVHRSSPWYNSTIKSAKRECRRAERKWRSTKLTIHQEIYLAALKSVTSLIESAKKQFYREQVESANQKSVYKLANDLLYKSKDLALPLSDSASDLANRFNNFFVEKIVKIRNDLAAITLTIKAPPNATSKLTTSHPMSQQLPPKAPVLHNFDPTSEEEIRKIVMSSKTTQCSLDPIPTRLLKNCIDVLLPILTRCVNISLSQGIMPQGLKKALVFPLLKKATLNADVLKNFRPVSNLAYLSKLIERVVAIRLRSHMNLYLLNELFQSSYKCFHSCETALLKVKNDILQAIDNKKCVLLVLLDLSAAFDTVDHQKLLDLLCSRLGITGTALEWFRSYLSDRIQSVVINGSESDFWNILFGVPQGSVLGPILFIIYTSPLGDILRHHGIMFHLYADDTQLYLSFNIDQAEKAFEKMEACINDVRIWMANNWLHLNDSKTEVLLIGSKSSLAKLPDSLLTIGEVEKIKPSSTARNIGVMFDDTLSMDCQVSHLCKGAWNHLRHLGQIRHYLDMESAKTLMHSYVSSRLDCFNSLLYGLPSYQINRLQRIQNAAARVVSLSKKFDHITPVLIRLHWLPIAHRIQYKILLFTYKALHGLAPQYISDLLTISNKERCLRSNSRFMLSIPKTSTVKYGDSAFSHAAPYLWNKLPDHCRMAKSLADFKSSLKSHLFQQAFKC